MILGRYSETLADTISGTFTDQERNRSLGQAGTRVFEKYYNDHFIRRDIQNVVPLQHRRPGYVTQSPR
jgi:hypothetical protein